MSEAKMSDAAQVQTSPVADGETRIVALVGYGLFILALANGLTAIAGVVLAYVKRADAKGTIYESHFTNMIRVFWTCIAVTMAFLGVVLFGAVDFLATANTHPQMALIALVPLLYVLVVGFLVWYLYRTVRGLVLAIDGKPY
jgi:uncharacterized membrane protein